MGRQKGMGGGVGKYSHKRRGKGGGIAVAGQKSMKGLFLLTESSTGDRVSRCEQST